MAPEQNVAEALATINEIARGLTVVDIHEVSTRKRLESMTEAPAEACRTCPWRRTNAGSEDRHLTDENVVEMWNKLRGGTALACHKTVAREAVMTEEDFANGWLVPPASVTPRECAGALATAVKEENLLKELGSYEAYFNVRGTRGMTELAFRRLAQRRAGGTCVIPVRESKTPDLYGRSWIPDPNGANTLPIAPPCFCLVCKRHDEVHVQADVTPPGSDSSVSVDAALAPLLGALWGVGAITLASCENLRGAVAEIDPEQLPQLEAAEDSDFNYSHVVRHGLAFVRGVNGPAWDEVADEVERHPLGQVMELGPGIQLAFRLEDLPRLLEAL